MSDALGSSAVCSCSGLLYNMSQLLWILSICGLFYSRPIRWTFYASTLVWTNPLGFYLCPCPWLFILLLPMMYNEAPLGQGWCGPVQALWSVHALSSDFKGGDIVFTRTFFIVLTYVLADSSSLWLQARLGLVQSWIVFTRLVLWTSCYLFIGKKYKLFVFTNSILVHLQVSGSHWNVQNSLLSPCSTLEWTQDPGVCFHSLLGLTSALPLTTWSLFGDSRLVCYPFIKWFWE